MKRVISLVCLFALICSLFSVAAFAGGSDVTLEVTADKTSYSVGGAVDVIFTISAKTGTNKIGTCFFVLVPSEGLTLSQDSVATQGGTGYWCNSNLGFSSITYNPTPKKLGAFGSTVDTASSGDFVIMTIKGTIAAGTEKDVSLSLTDCKVGPPAGAKYTVTANEAKVAVQIPITGIQLSPTTASVTKGEKTQLTATVLPENTTEDKTVTWSSDNKSVATVDSNGEVTGVAVGNAIIKATCGGKSATCAVTVSSDTLSVSDITGPFTYDGKAQTPSVVVKNKAGNTLLKDTDYSISYTNNTNAGEATITVTGIGNYSDCAKVEKTFTIGKASNNVTDPTITGWTYGDTANAPTGSTATFGTVTYQYSDSETGTYTTTVPSDAGTYYVKAFVEGTANYDAATSSAVSFTIAKKALNPDMIADIESQELVTAGTEVKPDVTVKDGTKALFEGTDYTLVYSNNTDVGTAKATITACDNSNYSGTAEKSFGITKRSIEKHCDITINPEEATYTGSAIKPTVTIKDRDNSKTLVENVDYTEVIYSENIDAGTAKITINGKGDYAGSLVTKEFKILQATNTVSKPTIEGWTYGESANTPTGATAKFGTPVYKYSDSSSGDEWTTEAPSNAGTYYVSAFVNGTKNYTEAKSEAVKFEIKAKELTSVTVDPVVDQTFTGKAITPALTVKYNGVALELNKDYTVEFKDNVNVGGAKADITLKGNYTGTIKNAASFTIVAKNASSATVATIANSAYTGNEQKPTPKITLDGVELKAGTDYELSYANNTDAGTATLTATFKNNYYGSVSQGFTIDPVELTVTVDDKQSKKYGDANPEAYTYQVDGLVNNEKADVVFTGALSRVAGENVGTYAIIQNTLVTNPNYVIKTFISKNFTIEPNLKVQSGDGSSFTEQKASDIEFEIAGAPNDEELVVTIGGNDLVKDTDYTVDVTGKITVLASVLNTLDADSYKITFSYTDGGEVTDVAQATITVNEDTSKKDASDKTDKTDNKSGQKGDDPAVTGDDATPVLFAVIVLVCAAALVVLLIVRKKKTHNNG